MKLTKEEIMKPGTMTTEYLDEVFADEVACRAVHVKTTCSVHVTHAMWTPHTGTVPICEAHAKLKNWEMSNGVLCADCLDAGRRVPCGVCWRLFLI